MSTVNFNQKRKRLTIGLGVALAASSILIAMERIKERGAPNRSGRAGQVRGESAISDPALAQYRSLARQSFTAIQDNFGPLPKGEALDGAVLTELQNNLLSAVVPAPYQNLHLRLVNLIIKMREQNEQNRDFLREQIRLLRRDYQWLANNEDFQ